MLEDYFVAGVVVQPSPISSSFLLPYYAAQSLHAKVKQRNKCILSAKEVIAVREGISTGGALTFPNDRISSTPLMTRTCAIFYPSKTHSTNDINVAVIDSDDAHINPILYGTFGFTSCTNDAVQRALEFSAKQGTTALFFRNVRRNSSEKLEDMCRLDSDAFERLLLGSLSLPGKEKIQQRKTALLSHFDDQVQCFLERNNLEISNSAHTLSSGRRRTIVSGYYHHCAKGLEELGIDVSAETLVSSRNNLASFLLNAINTQRLKYEHQLSPFFCDSHVSSLDFHSSMNITGSLCSHLLASGSLAFVCPVILEKDPRYAQLDTSFDKSLSFQSLFNTIEHAGMLISPHIFAYNGIVTDDDYIDPLPRFERVSRNDATGQDKKYTLSVATKSLPRQ